MAEFTSLDDLESTPHAEVFDQRTPRTVRLELDAGESVPPHTHPDTNVVLHLLSGRLELSLDDETRDLSPGDVARFSGNREISPRATEDSRALVMFAPAE